MQEYFKGNKLFGDNFTTEQIKVWYEQESEGYADLGNKDEKGYKYSYHGLNELYGFSKIEHIGKFENVMGFGSSWGHEFEPIISKIGKLTIIEPSDNMKSNKIGDISPVYVKPNVDGKLDFPDNSFDLITCFGTLHHIPNVSFVLKELIRVLKTDGYLLIREPIVSMGDWNFPRKGVTKNERGIPVKIFDKIFFDSPVKVERKSFFFTLTSFLQKFFRKISSTPLYTNKIYLVLDKYLSTLFSGNNYYHRVSFYQKIGPSSVYYVIRKT